MGHRGARAAMLVVMAQHRRVEPRGIIGTGMAADAERIRDVEHDQERKQRAWRNAPEKGFGDVLATAPAKAELEDEPHDDPRKKKPAPTAPEGAPAPVEMASSALGAAAPPAGPAAPAAPAADAGAKSLPKVPRDPRERMLREQLAKNQAAPRGKTTNDTPPTGSHARKPAR
jgi:hypothetical protein